MDASGKKQKCTICLDSFKDPRLISCHHSFCCKCLEDYVSVNLHNGKFKCPICKRSVKLPKKGVAAFQANFYFDSRENTRGISDGSSNGLMCDICGPQEEAACRCQECMQNLCQFCCKHHEKLTATKNHTLYNIGSKELEISGQTEKRAFCRKHPGEEIQLVCIQCRPNITMCLKCKAYDHDTHPSKSITEAAADIKRSLNIMLRQSENSDKKLDDQEERDIEVIDRQHSKLRSALDLEVANMKDKVKTIYRKLRKENAVLTLAKNEAMNLIEQSSCTEIVEKGQDLQHSFSKAISQINPLLLGTKNTLFVPSVICPGDLTALMGTLQAPVKEYHNISDRYGRRLVDERYSSREAMRLDPRYAHRFIGVETFRQEAEALPNSSNSQSQRCTESHRNAFERPQQKTQFRYDIFAGGGKEEKKSGVLKEMVPIRTPIDQYMEHGLDSISNPSETEAKEVSDPSYPNEEIKVKEVSDPSNPDEETKVKEVLDVSIPDRSGPEGSSGASSVSTETSLNSEIETDSRTTDEDTRPKEMSQW